MLTEAKRIDLRRDVLHVGKDVGSRGQRETLGNCSPATSTDDRASTSAVPDWGE
jgi:hypothetical protein